MDSRPAHQGKIGKRVLLAALCAVVLTVECTAAGQAAPVPVKYLEGMVHGFLVLRDARDSVLAHGELLQQGNGSLVRSRMLFRFGDGSIFDERVTFTQSHLFAMQSYSLEMSGPTFRHDQAISLQRPSGAYKVRTVNRETGESEVDEGKLDLPDDVYNGMLITIAKNLTGQASTRVHFVAFMPAPKLISLDLVAGGARQFKLGAHSLNAVHFVMKPQLGVLLELFAKVVGRMPPDNHVWVVSDDVPAFVRFEGTLFTEGPIWRIDLSVPR